MITDMLFGIFSILLTSTLIDRFLREKAVMRWRVSTYAARHSIREMSCSSLVTSSTSWLHSLLNLIRGEKLLSRKGVKSTFLLLVFFLTVSAYPLGIIGLWEAFPAYENRSGFALAILYFTVISTPALFISIHQTTIFAKFSSNKGVLILIVLFSLDMVLKIIVYTFFTLLSILIPAKIFFDVQNIDLLQEIANIYEKLEITIISIFTDKIYYRPFREVSEFDYFVSVIRRPFLLTTFLPSIIWLCFLSSSLLVWWLPRLYHPFGTLFSTVSKRRYPATTVAVFAVLPPTLILVVLNHL